jgi:hypothetical protein
MLKRDGHVREVGEADGDAGVLGLDRSPVALERDLLDVLVSLEHDLAARAEALGRPLASLKALPGGGDGRLRVFPAGLGDIRDHLAV